MNRSSLYRSLAAVGLALFWTLPALGGSPTIAESTTKQSTTPEKWWSADLEVGYSSILFFRGISILGNSANDGVATTLLSATFKPIPNLSINPSVFLANGISENKGRNANYTAYQVLFPSLTATYSIGPVDLSAAYLYYYNPYASGDPSFIYDVHEIMIGAAYTAIPHLTPSTSFYYDTSRWHGWYGQIDINGDYPVYRDILTLKPMFWTGIDFGSNRRHFAGGSKMGGTAGMNDIGIGLKAVIKVNDVISITPFVKASFPIGSGVAINSNYEGDNGSHNHLWGGIHLTFSY